MRVCLGAAVLVGVVVGGSWLVLALTFSQSHGSSGAFARSATCVRNDRFITSDRADAARFRAVGLRTLGLRWSGVRTVALFSESLAPDPVTREEARIASRLRSQGLSAREIATRLLHEDNVGLFYVNRSPSQGAQAA